VAQSVVTQLLMREIGTLPPASSGGECAPPHAAAERAPPRATAQREPLALTALVLKALPRDEQLDMLDVLSEQLLPPDEAGCLRDCVLALNRIRAYRRPAEGGKTVRMANFVRTILQAVARGGMALDTMTTWAFFYGARPWDDAHRDVSSNNLSWTVDGGFYMEALRDLKWVGGERVLQMARGPFHSGMLKSEEVGVNDYKIARDFGEQEQVERIFWSFLPCPRTIRGVCEKEDLLPHAGMSKPLAAAVAALIPGFVEVVCGPEPRAPRSPLCNALKRSWSRVAYDPDGAADLLSGGKGVALVARKKAAQPAPEHEPALTEEPGPLEP